MNPTHIIAEHRRRQRHFRCECGWEPDYRDAHKPGIQLHAEHVVSKLTEHGYSIIDQASADELAAHREDRELDRRWAARCDLNDLRCFDCDLRYGERQDYACHGSDHSYNEADVARLAAAAEGER